MDNYFFYKCIRRTVIQFLDCFNNISIERYDVNGNIKGKYQVPIRYGPKSKAYQFIRECGRNEEMLPFISIYSTGIDFDSTRLTNKFQDIVISEAGGEAVFAKNAMPYNIGFTLNIWALHMVDIDQIYEQILPYFGPHAFIRVKIPEMDVSYDVKVVLNGCSPVMTDDVGEEEARVLKWDTTFTVQTYLFKPKTTTKVLIGSTNLDSIIGTATGNWSTGTTYALNNLVLNDGIWYRLITPHISTPNDEPGVGGNWPTYWERVSSGTSGTGSNWTPNVTYHTGEVICVDGTNWYTAIQDGVATLENKPESGDAWYDYWRPVASGGTSGISPEVKGTWINGVIYNVGDVIYDDGKLYQVTENHTSSVDNKPTTGSYWFNFWQEIPKGFYITSGFGTSGFGSVGTSGKIVNRYYTDPHSFSYRDKPQKEIFDDGRPAEVMAQRPIGLDEEAKIILDYESFGNE